MAQKVYSLERRKHRQGDLVQRFGNFRQNLPEVLIPMNEWRALKKPDTITVIVEMENE